MSTALAKAMEKDFDAELHALLSRWSSNCVIMKINPVEVVSYPLLLHAVRSFCMLAVMKKDMNAGTLYEMLQPVIREQFEASFAFLKEEYEVSAATERARQ